MYPRVTLLPFYYQRSCVYPLASCYLNSAMLAMYTLCASVSLCYMHVLVSIYYLPRASSHVYPSTHDYPLLPL